MYSPSFPRLQAPRPVHQQHREDQQLVGHGEPEDPVVRAEPDKEDREPGRSVRDLGAVVDLV